MAKHPVIVLRIVETVDHKGGKVTFKSENHGVLGIMPVYESKKAARKVWGKKVPLAMIEKVK